MKDQKEIQKLVDDYAQALKDLENTTDMEKKEAAQQRKRSRHQARQGLRLRYRNVDWRGSLCVKPRKDGTR